jgi:hypothetical protein
VRNLVEVDAARFVEHVEERVGRVLDVRLFLAGDDRFEEDAALLRLAALVVVMLDRAEPVILGVQLEGVDVRPLLDDRVGHFLVGEGAVVPRLALRLVGFAHLGADPGDVGNARAAVIELGRVEAAVVPLVALRPGFLASAAPGALDRHAVRAASGEHALVDGAVLGDERVIGFVQRLALRLGAPSAKVGSFACAACRS